MEEILLYYNNLLGTLLQANEGIDYKNMILHNESYITFNGVSELMKDE